MISVCVCVSVHVCMPFCFDHEVAVFNRGSLLRQQTHLKYIVSFQIYSLSFNKALLTLNSFSSHCFLFFTFSSHCTLNVTAHTIWKYQFPCHIPRLSFSPYSGPLAMAFYYKHLDLLRSFLFSASLAWYSFIAREMRRILFQPHMHAIATHNISVLSCVLWCLKAPLIRTAVFFSVAAFSNIGHTVCVREYVLVVFLWSSCIFGAGRKNFSSLTCSLKWWQELYIPRILIFHSTVLWETFKPQLAQ